MITYEAKNENRCKAKQVLELAHKQNKDKKLVKIDNKTWVCR
jgi:hypothetical protein